MRYYKELFLLCIISLLFCLASVSASDVQANDTNMLSTSVQEDSAVLSTNDNVYAKEITKTEKEVKRKLQIR